MLDYHQVITACPICQGTGYVDFELCSCWLNYRVSVYLSSGNFSVNILKYVSDTKYVVPMIESGESSLDYMIQNPDKVLDRGLSLYVFSREAGRGKTCLVTYIVKEISKHFLKTENYRSGFSVAFQTANDLLDDALAFNPVEAWKTASIYVLDDLGNENRATKQKREAMAPSLQRVLQYRRNEGLPTLITANYTPEDLGNLYEGRINSLLEIDLEGTIHGNLFRQIEVGGGEDLRTLTSAWED